MTGSRKIQLPCKVIAERTSSLASSKLTSSDLTIEQQPDETLLGRADQQILFFQLFEWSPDREHSKISYAN